MATMNVVPEIWAREIIEQLPLYTALGGLANIVTGEINRKGDQLHIIGADAVSVAAYPASDNITYAAAADTDNTLLTIAIQALTLYAASRATNFGDASSLNGYVGRMFGFDVYTSNKCPVVSTTVHGVAGVKGDGIAGAVAIPPTEVEEIRLEGRFASGVRARALYGWKVYRPTVLVDVNLNTTLLA
jgi:hypothetical protein